MTFIGKRVSVTIIKDRSLSLCPQEVGCYNSESSWEASTPSPSDVNKAVDGDPPKPRTGGSTLSAGGAGFTTRARNPQYFLNTVCAIDQWQLSVFPTFSFSKWRISLLEILTADILVFPIVAGYVDDDELQNLVHRLPSLE